MNIYKYNTKSRPWEDCYVVAKNYATAERLIKDKYKGIEIKAIEQVNDNTVIIEGIE